MAASTVEQRIDSLENKVDYLEDALIDQAANTAEQMRRIGIKIHTLKRGQEKINHRLDKMQADIDVLKSDVSALKSDVSALKDKVDEILKILQNTAK